MLLAEHALNLKNTVRVHAANNYRKWLDMTRFFDVVFSLAGLIIGAPALLVIYVVGLFDTGSPLFFQERVGRDQKPFTLVKFRTMRPDTASVASHLADASAITPLGAFLRRTKLDELPQLWNVLKGAMSLVGPRPCLFNQTELIAERHIRGVFEVRPGITGLAQVNTETVGGNRCSHAARIDTRSLLQIHLYDGRRQGCR